MIDWNKPLQTKEGHRARVIDRSYKTGSGGPIYVVITGEPGFEVLRTYTPEGQYYTGVAHELLDLENVPEETVTECFFNTYVLGVGPTYSTLREADKFAHKDRTGVVRITLKHLNGKLISYTSHLL